MTSMDYRFENSLSFAKQEDQADPLGRFRSKFYFPQFRGKDSIYFCGNSLGLQPKGVESAIAQELNDWRDLGVGGYLHAKNPWLYYQNGFKKALSTIAGCEPMEVTVMNTLTVNLHLMMLSFYHPTKKKNKIIMEAGAFPSDQYAIETQVRFYGLDPERVIVEIHPRPGEKIIHHEDILSAILEHQEDLALVLMGGINYYSGQLFDIKEITSTAHRVGATAGFDLAHAIGNVPLFLHEWDVDFAVWCSYKYLNGGPGATGGVYIHQKHATNTRQVRMAGWWGNDEKTRFLMEKGFAPKPDASGWNISTAQVFNMAALSASLELFEASNMEQIRSKSIRLTGYLEFLLNQLINIPFEVITPRKTDQRGAQLSLHFKERGKEIYEKMTQSGIVVDFREPGVIRVAPAPLYNSFEDVFNFYDTLKEFN
jgi:kynureninase